MKNHSRTKICATDENVENTTTTFQKIKEYDLLAVNIFPVKSDRIVGRDGFRNNIPGFSNYYTGISCDITQHVTEGMLIRGE